MNEINIKLCAHRKKAKAARRVECSVCFSAAEEGEWGESREREVEVLKRPIKPEKETQLTNICSAWVTGTAEIHAMRSSHSLLTQQLCLIFTRPLKSNKTRNYAQTVCECFWYLMRLLCARVSHNIRTELFRRVFIIDVFMGELKVRLLHLPHPYMIFISERN